MNLPATRPGDNTLLPESSLQRLRAEGNFLRFPFFDLTRESAQDERGSIQLVETRHEPDGSRKEIVWRVSRDTESSFPGEFARRLHREVVERLLSELPRPVTNPLRLGSFSDICRKLDIAPSGAAIRRIRSALCSIVTTTVRSSSAFYSKARESYLDRTFHLYDRIDFAGDKLPDGQVSDAIYVYLGSWYLESINANYLIPLDFPFFRQLKGAVTSRLYELAHHWFYTALRNQKTTIERSYSSICAHFPLKQNSTRWRARQQFRPAYQQLISLGFLAREPEWLPMTDRSDDWTLVFTAGPRAIDEYHANQRRRSVREVLTPAEAATLPPSLTEVQRDLLTELVKRGITDSVATSLVEHHEPVDIQQHLEMFDSLVSQGDRRVSRNPAGYLRKAIEQRYARPGGYVTRAEREQQAAAQTLAKKAEQQAEAAAARLHEERTAHLEALWAALSRDKQQQLQEQALTQLNDFARRAYTRELQEGRQASGHFALRATIYTLLERD